MNDCDNCFYSDTASNEHPCDTCTYKSASRTYSNWVAVDVFKSIDNGKVIPPPSYNPEDVAFTKTTVGVKYDNDKPQWSLLPFRALKEVVEVLTYGAKKYAPDNWKKVPDARRRYIDAGFRHFTAYASGETRDIETGKHHLAHAICCLLYLVAFDLGEHHD